MYSLRIHHLISMIRRMDKQTNLCDLSIRQLKMQYPLLVYYNSITWTPDTNNQIKYRRLYQTVE